MAHDPTRESRRLRCPEDVLGWIPWYPEGSLSAREKGAVEAHAAECGDCRSELDLVADRPWAFDGIDFPDASRLFEEITARIEADAQTDQATVIPISRGRVLSAEDVTRVERWVQDSESELDAEAGLLDDVLGSEVAGRAASAPGLEAQRIDPSRRSTSLRALPLWAVAAAIALLAVGGLAGAVFEKLRSESTPAADPAAYQLASVATAADGPGMAPMLDVVFSDSVSAREIWSTLRSLGVEIVAGPTNLGAYRLRLLPSAAGDRAPTPTAAMIAARLVAPESPLAIFAEPVP